MHCDGAIQTFSSGGGDDDFEDIKVETEQYLKDQVGESAQKGISDRSNILLPPHTCVSKAKVVNPFQPILKHSKKEGDGFSQAKKSEMLLLKGVNIYILLLLPGFVLLHKLVNGYNLIFNSIFTETSRCLIHNRLNIRFKLDDLWVSSRLLLFVQLLVIFTDLYKMSA